MKFAVTIHGKMSLTVDVEATSAREAEKLVEGQWNDGDFSLDYFDLYKLSFTAFEKPREEPASSIKRHNTQAR